MKKALILMLIAAVLLCGIATAEGPLSGGWEALVDVEPLSMPEEALEAFPEEIESIPSAVVPKALLATQVVAGTNYCYLCTLESPDEGFIPGWCLLYVYVDLEGESQFLAEKEIAFDAFAADEPAASAGELSGGWTVVDNPAMEAALFEKAGIDTAECAPVMELATQVVAGTNHCFLCRDAGGYALIYIYEDLQGGAEQTGRQNIAFSVD